MDSSAYIVDKIDSSLIPILSEFIKIPNLSPGFDSEWESNGLMNQAIDLYTSYMSSLGINGLQIEVLKEDGRPWLMYATVEAADASKPTVLFYGHLDKQPHFHGWKEGTATSPLIIDGRLYGRGSVDDGYSIPLSSLMIKGLQEFSVPHGRFIIIGETEEESGSPNLMHYMGVLKDRIGVPDIIVCLDTGTETYDTISLTNSLRGIVNMDVNVKVLENARHSGYATGVIPSSMRVMRILMSRVEDELTGRIRLPELTVPIPPSVYKEVYQTIEILGDQVINIPMLTPGVRPVTHDLVEFMLNKSWKPGLEITGADGFPRVPDASNVMRPNTEFRFSFRLPPTVNANHAADAIVREITRDPPYGSQVIAKVKSTGNGWHMSKMNEKLKQLLQDACKTHFQQELMFRGGGGSIPFVKALNEIFTEADILVTGVVGPDSNMHAANENINLSYLKKFASAFFQSLINFY